MCNTYPCDHNSKMKVRKPQWSKSFLRDGWWKSFTSFAKEVIVSVPVVCLSAGLRKHYWPDFQYTLWPRMNPLHFGAKTDPTHEQAIIAEPTHKIYPDIYSDCAYWFAYHRRLDCWPRQSSALPEWLPCCLNHLKVICYKMFAAAP